MKKLFPFTLLGDCKFNLKYLQLVNAVITGTNTTLYK